MDRLPPTQEYCILSPFEHEGLANTLDTIAEFYPENAALFSPDPIERLAALEEATFDDFCWLMRGVNQSIMYDYRDMPEDRLHSVTTITQTSRIPDSKKQIVWGEYVAPDARDQMPLLREAFEAAQKLGDLEQAATLMQLALVAIHPLGDGHHRTAWGLHDLFVNGYDGSDEARARVNRVHSHPGRELLSLIHI